MPIATPEVYADMLDRAKAGSFAYPAINVSSSQTLNAALKGFADAGSDGIVQVSTGGAEYLSGPIDQEHGQPARSPSRPTRTRWPRTTPSTSRCTPTTAPRTSWTASSGRCSPRRPSGSRAAALPWFQSHMWDGSAVPLEENLQIAQELLELCQGRQRHPRDRGRRRRRRGGRRRPRDQREALLDARGRDRHGQGARPRRERPLPDGAHLRQRARRLQAGQRQAAPRGAQGRAGCGARGVRPARRRKPFDLVFHGGSGSLPEEITAAVDYGVVKMNIDTDTQYAFTRPVAGYMLDQLRRRAQGRRRGRQQEAVRPARLGQGGRGRHGRSDRRGLRAPARRRDPRVTMSTDGGLLGVPETRLPVDPAAARLGAGEDAETVAAAYPVVVAGVGAAGRAGPRRRPDRSRPTRTRGPGTTAALDALRRAGWRGQGPIPWSHEPNQGFLRALAALHRAARAIGETEEEQRTATFLRDSSREAAETLGV